MISRKVKAFIFRGVSLIASAFGALDCFASLAMTAEHVV